MVIITIDTSKDTKEDILKTIDFLKSIAGNDNATGRQEEPRQGSFDFFGPAEIPSGEKQPAIQEDREESSEKEEKPKEEELRMMFY